ncbi:MAG: hypothetical protein KKH32_07970 [Bacteroidetes bacterium]|nr:hypothetical protein [Bacteroidota bacterium]
MKKKQVTHLLLNPPRRIGSCVLLGFLVSAYTKVAAGKLGRRVIGNAVILLTIAVNEDIIM